MKSYCVTIKKKPLQQYFQMVLFVLDVVLTFESVVSGQLKPFKQSLFFVLLSYACQADFEFISLVSQQNNNVTQTSSSCCSSRFTVS